MSEQFEHSESNDSELETFDFLQMRYDIMKERMADLSQGASFCGVFENYVVAVAKFVNTVFGVYEQLKEGSEQYDLAQYQEWNTLLYQDILPDHYSESWANPDVAVKAYGTTMGQMLSFLYTEIRSMIPSAYEDELEDLVIFSELFVEVVTLMEDATLEMTKCEDESEEYASVKEQLEKQMHTAIRSFEHDYSETIVAKRTLSQLDSTMDFATKIVMESDLEDLKYLYYYGEYIGENEIKSAQYLNSLDQSAVDDMAFTYTDGYREGFEIAGIDLSKKKTVNIRYNVGFERMIKAAINQFEALGLKPVMYRAATKSLDKKRQLKIGYTATSPNRQYDYDHRYDDALYFDKAFIERKMEVLRATYEANKDLCAQYAGPACIEVFGETEFEPVTKETATKLDTEQQQQAVKLASKAGQLVNQYIPHDQYSFTIIAYPLPEIGDDYEDIFTETVKVNTLDKKMYKEIQQSLIDALDEAEYVHVLGANGNQTDIKVMLHEKQNPEKETNFENCLADVNIPVGEVFTSPKLTGTNGVLHVSSVYLNDLYYKNLKITFEDGMVKTYDCTNFEDEEENQKFIKENLLNHRDTLPIGEFAIGTNTTAYVMARKYQILHKLPILIVEKMGPHFAVGDTCYSHSEEVKLFNPDGKEIVAKENECSLLRFEDEEKAYFNIHTDITIPYEEIGLIEAVRSDKSSIALLKDGRFVLPGTEGLNLKEMEEWL